MPDHIGDALAHRPAKDRLCGLRKPAGRRLGSRKQQLDARRRQHLARAGQLARERRLPVASDGLAHLFEGFARDRLDITDLCRRALRRHVHETPRQLALEHDQREAMAQ